MSAIRATTVVAYLLLVIETQGQQTIFNVPTTDILDPGKVYAELDFAFKLDDTRFSSFIPRIVIGTGGNVEIGVNLTGNIQPGEDVTAIVPTIKYRFYQTKKTDFAIIAGTNIFIPVRNRTYDFGSYSYVAGSKTIKKARLTAGAFIASRNVLAPNVVKAGGQFGFEQTINDKLTLAADWITGNHASGYFTPGVIYKPHPKVTTYWSYSIGNSRASSGNQFVLFELGYNFN